ncbi:hypothetical protein F5Y08DRAFT_306400 [Xylaria arbuscula]|nr:hypothetical protein F5Y08DRAFT_306400 [Xylaria arbuscula]
MATWTPYYNLSTLITVLPCNMTALALPPFTPVSCSTTPLLRRPPCRRTLRLHESERIVQLRPADRTLEILIFFSELALY